MSATLELPEDNPLRAEPRTRSFDRTHLPSLFTARQKHDRAPDSDAKRQPAASQPAALASTKYRKAGSRPGAGARANERAQHGMQAAWAKAQAPLGDLEVENEARHEEVVRTAKVEPLPNARMKETTRLVVRGWGRQPQPQS